MKSLSSCGTALLDVLVAVSAALQTASASQAGVVDIIRRHLVEYMGRSVLLFFNESHSEVVVRMATFPDIDKFKFDDSVIEGCAYPLDTVPALQETAEGRRVRFFSRSSLLAGDLLPAAVHMPGGRAPYEFDRLPTICAPILINDTVQGLLGIAARRLTRDDEAVVEGLANCIALALTPLHYASTVREPKAQLRMLVDRATDPMFVAEQDGTLIDVTPSGCSLLGYTRDKLRGMHLTDLISQDEADADPLKLDELTAGDDIMLERRIMRQDGTPLYVEIYARMLPNGRLHGMVRDVTPHTQTQVALARRDGILMAAAVAATQFLRDENWQANVEEILAQLGKAAQVSRVYIFENHTDENGTLRTSYRFEWVAQGITPQLNHPDLQNLPYDAAGFRRWRETLSAGNLIHGIVSEFPPGERELLQAQDIKSIVVVPIFADGNWWGFIGFDDCERLRDWSPAQFDALRTVANTLGAAIHRERAELAIHQYTERLRALRDIDEAILDAQTAEEIAGAALHRLRRLLGYPRASVVLLDSQYQELRFIALSDDAASRRIQDERMPVDVVWTYEELEAFRKGRLHVVEDTVSVDQPTSFVQSLRANGIRAFINIPLLAHGTLIGLLNVGTQTAGSFDDKNVEIMREIADSLAVALSQARLVEDLTAELHLTETLREVGALVTSELELDEVLETILDLLGCVVDFDSASILSITSGGNVALAVGRGFPDISKVREALPTLSDQLRTLVPTQDVALLRDTRVEDRWTEIPGAGNICSWVGAPLTVRGHLIGTLNVDSHTPYAYDESTAETVMTFANQAAIAIENARLFSETKLALSREQQLTEITRTLSSTLDLSTTLRNVVRRAAELLGADAGALALVSSDGRRITYPHLYNLPEHLSESMATRGEGVAWHVVQTGQSVLRSEYATSPHALPAWIDAGVHGILAVPLTTGNGCIGVLGLFKLNPESQFSWRDRSLAEAVGRQAGVAIRNARLHQQTERRAQRLAVLHQIDTTIATGGDLRLTLDVILRQITAQLDVDAADILLTVETPNTFEYAAGHGFRTDALQNTRLRLGEGHAGRAARERQPVFIEDLRTSPGSLKQVPLLPDEDFVSYYAVPLLAKGEVKGVFEFFYRRRIEPDSEWHQFMRTVAGQAAISIDNAQLFDDLQQSNAELELAYDATLAGWARALELRDIETQGHSQRVTELTVRLARNMGVPQEEIEHIRRGARLHDVGKMGISDSILLKPEQLSDEEWELMRLHPVYAYEMLNSIDFLAPALDIPHYHHERWDGSGYPAGLKGEQIPMAARIFAVVDVYDALTSDRPYRDAWTEEEALAHIEKQAGAHFDPDVVEAFLRFIDRNH